MRRIAAAIIGARAAGRVRGAVRRPTEAEATLDEISGGSEDLVRRAVEQRGGAIDALARGAWVVTIPNAASPTDQATRAARCALALAALRPEAPLFVATGRVLVSGEHRVGEVIDRAARRWSTRGARPEGGARVDAATAELLEGRFRVEGDGAWRLLVDEDDTIAPVRTLLGKPTPCVGARAAARAAGGDARAAAASRARGGRRDRAAGLGKTHLVHELLRRR